MAKRRREEMLDKDTYLTFNAERGYVWGPGCGEKRTPGTKPYWATGLPATWRYKGQIEPKNGHKNGDGNQ